MPQESRLDIFSPAVGIDDFPVSGFRHGVDGQVAAQQVLLDRRIGFETDLEAAVTRAGLAFAARQSVLFFGLGMKKNREVAAHGFESGSGHLCGSSAGHNPVDIVDLEPEQAVAYAAADTVVIHLISPPSWLNGKSRRKRS